MCRIAGIVNPTLPSKAITALVATMCNTLKNGGCPDNSIHAEINDIAFVPAFQNDVIGFNVVVGGFFSASRVEAAIPMNVWVAPSDVVDLCGAILDVYRDHGPRANRQKSRLMWLIDVWGVEKFRSEVETQMGRSLAPASAKDEINWDKRDHLGIYPQKQTGLNYAGLHIPAGRMVADDFFELARLAEVYGDGEMRYTVEQNIIIPNIPDSRLELNGSNRDRKSTRLNSSHRNTSRMPSSA